ncbi:MAG: hypothetical protein KGH75_07450 [Rhodospirillales bacterium]|nr:hypothetical protein [Rhodospirillales bacterium]
MRRIVFASLIALAPGLAFAQMATNTANPPAPPPAGMGGMGPGPLGGPMGGSMMCPPGHGGKGRHMMDPEQVMLKFYAANTSHDGHLTLAQAKAANLKPVVDHFSQIDTDKHGYVTFYDIQAWRMDDIAKHLEAQATALRAKDS